VPPQLECRIVTQFELSAQAETTLSAHAKYLVAHPEKRIRLEGHADERGNAKYNMELGKERAIAAAKHLLLKGVNAGQMLVTSLGETQPVKEGLSEGAYASNRRVEFKPVD